MLTANEINEIRADFPILKELIYNKPLIYFDNGATVQKPRQVLDALTNAYSKFNSNIHRGVHFLSRKATEAHEAARETVRHFINAKESRECIFTRGTTESINLLAWSFGEFACSAGDSIVISGMEHHSNIVPWQMLCERKGMQLKVVPVLDNGELDMQALKVLVLEKPKLVAITWVSNVLGTVNDVKDIVRLAHEHNVPVMLDAAQSSPHVVLDVQDIDVDFMAFSAHKMYGPTGIGVLYGKAGWLEQFPPYQGGGEMIETVTFEKTTYNVLPFKFEAGTPDFIGSVGMAEAIRYMQKIGIQNIADYEHQLLDYVTTELASVSGMRYIGTAPVKSAVLSFLIGDIHPFDLGTLLDSLGIAVRTGHHCAQPLMDRFGIPGTIRASFAVYNTIEEIDTFVAAVKRASAMLQ